MGLWQFLQPLQALPSFLVRYPPSKKKKQAGDQEI